MRVFRTVAAAGVVALAAIGLATAVAAPPAAAGKSTITGQFDVSWGGDGFQELQGTMAAITLSTGAREVWARTDGNGQKITGKGVGVAVVDSGIAPVTGLADPARVVNGPDLSFESQSPNLRYLDTFGHGTHMAGIIAGRDPNLSDAQLPTTPSFVGMAPGARLVDMKVAAADGSVDVSQVIAAIDWVVAHRNDPNLNIRVLNLSFGTGSLQDPRLDPLSHAVESAWRNGIVVVVAAGNDGTAATRLTMPAMNPYVVAVGAADPNGTILRTDDTVSDFSSRGSTVRHPDLVAPGRSVISLRDPGSYIDTNYPTGLVPGDTTGRFFRGSGTSQATAVVSGAAALLLQQRPTLTPDQVKKLLTSTADPMPKADPIGRGAGQLNVAAAARAAVPTSAAQAFPASLGTGSLEQSRGGTYVTDPVTGWPLTGEQDIMGRPWNAQAWSAAASTGTAWSGGVWNGTAWTGSDWSGTSWTGRTWAGRTWSGTNWAGVTWSSGTWSDAVWDGRTWSGRTWSGCEWTGRTWSGDYWSAG